MFFGSKRFLLGVIIRLDTLNSRSDAAPQDTGSFAGAQFVLLLASRF